MRSEQIEYVLQLEGLDGPSLCAASRTALMLVASEPETAEVDLPWAVRSSWPVDVAEAASRLRERFVDSVDRNDHYMQTGVRSLADQDVREDFITFAPHAYDATFWDVGHAEVGKLSDEGMSYVIRLTNRQRAALEEIVGAERVIALSE